jgi:hypothetical protein
MGASDNPLQSRSRLDPLPNPVVSPNGAITFPVDEHGRVLRDHGFVLATSWAPCPGGVDYQCVVKPGTLMMAYFCRPEQLMVIGCVPHVLEFAAERGLAKRRRHGSFLQSGLLVGEAKPTILGTDGQPLQ